MPLNFLQETPEGVLAKIRSDLSFIDPSIDLGRYAGLTTRKLQSKLREVRESIDGMRTGVYGSWLKSEKYVRNTLVAEALTTMIEQKTSAMRKERLTPGATYYTGVSQFGSILEGRYSIYLGEQFTGWIPFRETAAIAKAMQVLRHGTQDDFREIYVGIADGRPDALNEVSIAHIVNSSPSALKLIERYCDSRWDGPWPWEVDAPERLKLMIETRKEKNMKHITEMQRRFTRLLREFDEGGMGKFEMVSAAQDMMTQVDGMISNLGKLSSTGIQVMAQAKSTGEDSLVEPMQSALGEPLNAAVNALTDLKAALTQATEQLTGGAPAGDMGGDMDDMGDMGGDDLGSPMDAMGDEPIDDIEIGGDDGERPVKGI
jgi:hypothetical protein